MRASLASSSLRCAATSSERGGGGVERSLADAHTFLCRRHTARVLVSVERRASFWLPLRCATRARALKTSERAQAAAAATGGEW